MCVCVAFHSTLWLSVTPAFVLYLCRFVCCAELYGKSMVPQSQGGVIRAPDASSLVLRKWFVATMETVPSQDIKPEWVSSPAARRWALVPLLSCGVNSALLSLPLAVSLLRCYTTFLCAQCPCLRDPRASLTHSQGSWQAAQCEAWRHRGVQHNSRLQRFLLG